MLKYSVNVIKYSAKISNYIYVKENSYLYTDLDMP